MRVTSVSRIVNNALMPQSIAQASPLRHQLTLAPNNSIPHFVGAGVRPAQIAVGLGGAEIEVPSGLVHHIARQDGRPRSADCPTLSKYPPGGRGYAATTARVVT